MLLTEISMDHPFKRRVTLVPPERFSPAYRAVYGPLDMTLLVGPNGSGKTATLSLIARIFQYLERDRDRIRSPFSLTYEITRGDTRTTVTLAGEGSNLTATIGGGDARKVRPWTGRAVQGSSAPGEMTYDDLRPWLPSQVVIATFSTRGEYPERRPPNYKGDQRVAIFDIGRVYGRHHFGIGPLSGGIAKLAVLFEEDSPRIKPLKRLLGMEFTGRVRIHDRSAVEVPEYLADFYGNYRPPTSGKPNDGWIKLTPQLLKREARGEIYFNDLELTRDGRRLALSVMSSGEKILFVRILSLISAVTPNSLVLIEEPELHLDHAWTKQWVTLIHALFANTRAHFIVATHSFSFINAVFPENIVWFDGQTTRTPDFNTFLASETELGVKFFGTESRPNRPQDYAENKIETGSRAELEELLQRLGESHLRFRVFLQLKQLSSDDVEGS